MSQEERARRMYERFGGYEVPPQALGPALSVRELFGHPWAVVVLTWTFGYLAFLTYRIIVG